VAKTNVDAKISWGNFWFATATIKDRLCVDDIKISPVKGGWIPACCPLFQQIANVHWKTYYSSKISKMLKVEYFFTIKSTDRSLFVSLCKFYIEPISKYCVLCFKY
jgi:hypothetical protein